MALLAVLGVALAVRLVFFLQYRATPFGSMPIEDEAFYHEWALRLIEGGPGANPGVFHMSPFPAATIAFLYRLFGTSLDAVRGAHAIAGVGNVALMYLVTRSVFGSRTAVVAAAGLALSGPSVFYEASLLPIVLSITAPLVALLSLAASPRGRWPWRELAAGVALGVFAFVRGNALVLVPLFAAWVVGARIARGPSRGPTVRGALARGALVAAGALVALSPATFHNLRQGGELVLLTWHGGQNLFIGNHEGATGLYLPLVPGHQAPDEEREDAQALAEAATGRALSPKGVDAYWRSRVGSFVREHPGEAIRLLGRKALYLVSGTEFPDAHDYYYTARECSILALLIPYGAFLPLGVAGIGLWLARARSQGHSFVRLGATPAALLAWGAVGYAASVVAFFVFGRYRLPVLAFLLPFAAFALVEGSTLVRAKRWRLLAPSVILGVGMTLLVARPSVPRAFGLASAYYNVGLIHELRDEPGEARTAYREAIAHNARHFKSHLGLARLDLAAPGAPGPALDAARRAIELAPQDPEGWTLVGEALLRLGRREDARAAFLAALEASDTYTPAREALARLQGGTPNE
jgi:tetratricopeptide (TPR) repeat protein